MKPCPLLVVGPGHVMVHTLATGGATALTTLPPYIHLRGAALTKKECKSCLEEAGISSSTPPIALPLVGSVRIAPCSPLFIIYLFSLRFRLFFDGNKSE